MIRTATYCYQKAATSTLLAHRWLICLLAICFSSGFGATSTSRAADTFEEAQDHAVVAALLRLPAGTLDQHPEQREAVLRFLSRRVGTQQYIDVAKQLKVYDQSRELSEMLTAVPFNNLCVESARLLQRAGKHEVMQKALAGDTDTAISAATAMGYLGDKQTLDSLKRVLDDESANRQLRMACATAIGRTQPGQRMLLAMAKDGDVAEDVLFSVADSLLSSNSAEIKNAARKLLSPPTAANSEPLPPLKDLVKKRGDGKNGKLVFETVGTCNKCHKVRGTGKDVGPDLSEIGSKLSREDMYVAILNPSAAVSHNYETYSLADADGQVVSGLLINQNDESTTIRDAEGVDHTVAADDIIGLKKQSVSLMPADLQKAMSAQQLIDLVDYLVLLRKSGETPFHVLADDNSAGDQHDPSAAVSGFEIADGIQVELFASEPLLLSPTSIDVDAQGRIWICEAVNYRHFRNPYNKERAEGDRILVLEDTDGDGQADKRTVFYQGRDIDSPHGVCVLGERILVSAGENVIVFLDEDGDLKPESQTKLFTGISGVQHDHGIHAFGFGPDGKLYFNFGNEGKQLKNADGESIVDKAGNVVNDSRQPYQQGMVFRCNLDGSELETLGWNFRNNWEVCVDSYGGLWQSDNDDDGNRGTRINFVMEFGNYGYRDELTGDTWRVPRIGLEGEIPLQHWHLNDPGVVPNILQTGAGSPTGICFYEGDLLPPEFQNQLLHTDPGPNVVRAYPVEDDGAGYRASIRNLVKGVRDPWFRPVDVCAAPDGSLFVADWYDPGVGGHRMGDIEHGRIFRITPTGHQGYRVPEHDFKTPAGAIKALQSPNMATRFLAHQAIQSHGKQVIPQLEQLVESAVSDRMRARALWQLAEVSDSAHEAVQIALESQNPNLRMMGIRLARQHKVDVLDLVEEMKNDPSPQVRRELAIALRHVRHPRAIELWVDLAVQHDGQDRWYLEALGIAADGQWDACFDAWLLRVGKGWNSAAGKDIVWRCRSPKACSYLAQLIRESESASEQYRYFRAFDFHEGNSKDKALTGLLLVGSPPASNR